MPYKNKADKKAYENAHRRTLPRRFSTLLTAAKRRHIVVELTFETYRELVAGGKCEYCSGLLPEAGYGIDRIDRRLGYIVGNCVPCCSSCNYLKMKLEVLLPMLQPYRIAAIIKEAVKAK